MFNEYYNKNRITHLSIDSAEVASQALNNSSNTIDFQQALKVLNQNEKVVIVLHFEKGFTHKEISKITKQPLGTVKANIMRGKEKLKIFYNYER